MATISMNIDESKKNIYLLGDIDNLKNHRYAWRYMKDYLCPILDADKILVPVDTFISILFKILLHQFKYIKPFLEEQHCRQGYVSFLLIHLKTYSQWESSSLLLLLGRLVDDSHLYYRIKSEGKPLIN